MAFGECGRLPMCVQYHSSCIKYWVKLLHMPKNRYPKQCFKMLKALDDVGRHTWASKEKQLLFRYGFGIAWITQDVGQPDVFLLQFKQTLVDCMRQNW